MTPKEADDQDYVTVTPHLTTGKFNVTIMRYRRDLDGYHADKISVPLNRKAADSLAISWALIEKLEVR